MIGDKYRLFQVKLLKGVVIKKNENKRKHSCSDETEESKKDEVLNHVANASAKRKFGEVSNEDAQHQMGALTCIGILPGLGCYNDSSDSEISSDSDQDTSQVKLDMLGRKIKKKTEED